MVYGILLRLSSNDLVKFMKKNNRIDSYNIKNAFTFQVVLSSTQYIKKGLAYERLKDWLNEGLLLSTGMFMIFILVIVLY